MIKRSPSTQMKSGPRELSAYHAQILAGAQPQQQPKKGHAAMPELNLDDIAKQALESIPEDGWGIQALQRHFKLNYGQAVHVKDAMESLKATGGLLESESENPSVEDMQIAQTTGKPPSELHITTVPALPSEPLVVVNNQVIPAGYHIGTRGASKGKLVKDVPEKAPKTAPAPAASTDDAVQRHYNKLCDRVWAASQKFIATEIELRTAQADQAAYVESITQR